MKNVACAALFVIVSTSLQAAPPATHWVGTWSTAPIAGRNAPPPPRPAPAPSATAPAGGTVTNPAPPSAAPSPAPVFEPIGKSGLTLRQIIHVSLGGSSLRVVFSNEFGLEPINVGGASIALPTSAGAVQAESSRPLTFNGRSTITIPVGSIVVTDPVSLPVAPLSDLAISLFLPAQTISQLTEHPVADQTNYSLPGDHLTDAAFAGAKPFFTWQFLKGVDVMASAATGAIVAFGDSITDGAQASRDTNSRWPDVLARRLHADKRLQNLGILNAGISGNRLLHDGSGPNALARLSRDVFDQAGARYLIVLEGINDIGRAYGVRRTDPVTAEDLIQAYVQIIDRAHAHGIKVILATLTPYVGAAYSSAEGQAVRVAVNDWIRSTRLADGLIDFDKATLDPAHPDQFLPAYDHGDHLHPGDAGYKAMGDSIDLSVFTR